MHLTNSIPTGLIKKELPQGRNMTTKSQTIDQLIQLSTKVAKEWLKNPNASKSDITNKAILAVCKHLSHEASYRADVAELIHLFQNSVLQKK